jgi:polyisoprenoid-binding protein YceI
MEMKTTWAIDPGHSEVQFKVRHLGIANVSGVFRVFNGYLDTNADDFIDGDVHFEVDASSVDTNNAERDKHLQSELFLHAEKSPKIVFTGKVVKDGDDYQLSGNLTIVEITKPIKLNVIHTGTGVGRFSDRRIGFEVLGSINRKDFGINFNLANDLGNLVVGEHIKIQCDVELIAQ